VDPDIIDDIIHLWTAKTRPVCVMAIIIGQLAPTALYFDVAAAISGGVIFPALPTHGAYD
jgi:hypothetical protein